MHRTRARRARQAARALLRQVQQRLQGRDVVVLAAALAFFATIAVVPVAVVAVYLSGALVTPGRVTELGSRLADALPVALGAPAVVDVLVRAGLDAGPLGALLALLPTTVYGEGLRRVLLRLQGPRPSGGRDTGTRWRGRLAVLPLVVLTPALLLPLLLGARLVADLQDRGGAGWSVLGGVVGYYTVLGVLLVPVAWSFRVVAAGRVQLAALSVGSFLTAASLAGFLQGFVLFLALPLDLGAPFGRLTAVGAGVAAVLWLFLLHVVLLLGWVLTLSLQQRWDPAPAGVA